MGAVLILSGSYYDFIGQTNQAETWDTVMRGLNFLLSGGGIIDWRLV